MSVTADLVTALGGDTARVYAAGKVPSPPSYPYRVVIYADDAPVLRTIDGDGNPVRRFTVQHFSRSAAGLEIDTADTFATFDGKPFDGDICSLDIATRPSRDPDDRGVYGVTHVYTF